MVNNATHAAIRTGVPKGDSLTVMRKNHRRMTATVEACMVLLVFVVPTFAQNTRVELAFGYSNLSLPRSFEAIDLGIRAGRHSGFDLHQTVNITPIFAMENYFGYQLLGRSSLAEQTTLIADVLGGKFSLRKNNRVVPYVSAGFGGWCLSRCKGTALEFPNSRSMSASGLATKVGGGMDVNVSRRLAWKTDISRMSFHFDGWHSGGSVSTGIVFKINP